MDVLCAAAFFSPLGLSDMVGLSLGLSGPSDFPYRELSICDVFPNLEVSALGAFSNLRPSTRLALANLVLGAEVSTMTGDDLPDLEGSVLDDVPNLVAGGSTLLDLLCLEDSWFDLEGGSMLEEFLSLEGSTFEDLLYLGGSTLDDLLSLVGSKFDLSILGGSTLEDLLSLDCSIFPDLFSFGGSLLEDLLSLEDSMFDDLFSLMEGSRKKKKKG
jgi:hypothetical protein